MRSFHYFIVITVLILLSGCKPDQWIELFDGLTLNGWQASENTESWRIEDGAIVTRGPRSHLFYMGEAGGHDFRNFEFMADVKTSPGANSGIYFHTEFQETGWK